MTSPKTSPKASGEKYPTHVEKLLKAKEWKGAVVREVEGHLFATVTHMRMDGHLEITTAPYCAPAYEVKHPSGTVAYLKKNVG
jgi:hypothetical protein